MKIFIFEDVGRLTDRYHSGGGLVILAKDLEDAINLSKTDEDIRLSEEDIRAVITYELTEKEAQKTMFIFPDAGCC